MRKTALLCIIIVAIVIIVFITSVTIMSRKEKDENNDTDGNGDTIFITPQVSMNWNEHPEIPGRYTGNIVSIWCVNETGHIINETVDNTTVYIKDVNVTVTLTYLTINTTMNLAFLKEGYSMTIGNLTLNFTEGGVQDKLGSEDFFSIVGGQTGDTIELTYIPTGKTMCKYSLI